MIRRAANVVYTVLVFAQTASEFHADLTDTPYDIVFISSTYKNKLWLETDCPNIKRYDNLLDFCKCACCLPFYGTGSFLAHNNVAKKQWREVYKGISAIELKKSELRSLERFPALLGENVLRRKMIYS